MKLVRIAAAMGLAIAAAAAAGPAWAGDAGKKLDPDRKICKSRPVIGSRLARIRECATAQQWEDMELQERLGLQRKQINGDPGCSGGNPASCHPMGVKDSPI
ncbi:MAG: hypothetical protein QOJ27_2245 [Sphingomonadales bacterium]|nr:hypothetical protein [Sphingomonadales bacterium]